MPSRPKPPTWTPHKRIEIEYARSIQQAVNSFLQIPQYASLNEIFSRFDRLLGAIAERMARRMVTHVRVENARSWREAAAKGSKGAAIYRVLRAEMKGPVGVAVRSLVAENARLISTVPSKIRESVNREILEMQQKGMRPEAILREIRRRVPRLTRNEARLIARTETSKAAAVLTRVRSEDLGIQWYEWSTSRDQRVRPSHKLMNNVLVRWADPPSPEALAHIQSRLGRYNAGEAPNCRCTTLPLLRLNQVNWPHRCYLNGRIITMRLAEFKVIASI